MPSTARGWEWWAGSGVKNVDELKNGNGVFIVFTPVYNSIWVNIAFWKHGGEGEPVVAVDEIVMYIVDLGRDVVEVDNSDELNELNVDNRCQNAIVVDVDLVEAVWWYTVETIDLTR